MENFDDAAEDKIESYGKKFDENSDFGKMDMFDKIIAHDKGDNFKEDDEGSPKILDASHIEEYAENDDIGKDGDIVNDSAHENTGRVEEDNWFGWLFYHNDVNNHLTIDTSFVEEGDATPVRSNLIGDQYIEAPRQLSMEKIGDVMFSPPPFSPRRGTKEYHDEEREIYREVMHSTWSRSPLDYRQERTFKSSKHKKSRSNHQSYHHGIL